VDVLLLALFAAAVIRGVRMVWWYGAVFGLVVTPHVSDVLDRLSLAYRRRSHRNSATDIESWSTWMGRKAWPCSMIAALLVWIAFALSPTGSLVLDGESRAPEDLLSDATPRHLTKWLRENPPEGQIFNPQWWGDWMVWDGPPGLKVFMTTNMHLAPQQVWREYRIVRETRAGWSNVLNRHNVNTVALDKSSQTTLMGYLRSSDEWRKVYEDEMAMVFRRG
jgi:hypothetical protein